jgi:hypothetical protein
MENPGGNANLGASKRWRTGKLTVPKGLHVGEFEKGGGESDDLFKGIFTLILPKSGTTPCHLTEH